MPDADCEFRANENIYMFREELKIDKDSKLRCKVVEIQQNFSTFFIIVDYQMLIIAAIDENIVSSMLD